MKRYARFSLALVTAVAAVVTTAAPALASTDVCAGAVEADGCEFCSYNGLPVGSPTSYCDYGMPGYSWQGCHLWVAQVCMVGNIVR